MALTMGTAKTAVSRVDGGHNDTDQLSAAEDALNEVIDDWNMEHDFRWMLTDNDDDEIDIVAGTSVYALPSTMKRPYSARLISQNRTLIWTEMRHVDRNIRDQSNNGFTSHYTLYNADTAFDPTAASNIKLIKTPDYTATNELLVRYYELITNVIASDATNLKVPDLARGAFLAAGRVKYLGNKDTTEVGKLSYWSQQAQVLLQKMKEYDSGTMADSSPRLIPQTEYGAAYGRGDLPTDPWIS